MTAQATEAPPPVHVAASRFVTIELASTLTGFTPDAIRTKIKRGVWLDGREYVHAPDNRVLIDLAGYERWVTRRP